MRAATETNGVGVEPIKPKRRRAVTVLIVLLAVFLGLAMGLSVLAFRPFSTPSASMAPNLVTGDYFYVSKLAYGLSRQALPLEGLLPYRIGGRDGAVDPRRGDVVVFKLPSDGWTDYVKRVVGLLGDTLVGGQLVVNGAPVPRECIDDYATADYAGAVRQVARCVERLPGGSAHRIIETEGDDGVSDNTIVYTVPPGHVFTLGDNRDNLVDSRDLGRVGFVSFDNLVGRAEIVYLSLDEGSSDLRWGRMFTKIR